MSRVNPSNKELVVGISSDLLKPPDRPKTGKTYADVYVSRKTGRGVQTLRDPGGNMVRRVEVILNQRIGPQNH